MNVVWHKDITVAANRQRTEIEAEALLELANSISSIGLLHPIILRTQDGGSPILVAGERRLKAIETIWSMGGFFTHGGTLVPEGQIPCIWLHDLDPLDAMEVELEENIRRADLSWQDRSAATSKLYELRRLQAEKTHKPQAQLPQDIAKELYPDHHPAAASAAVREELILARNLSDPDVAKASSRSEGLKVIKRKEEAQRQIALGEKVGKTFGQHSHQLYLCDCRDWMKDCEASRFDVILTDPPYGIDAQNFNDSGGKANAIGHTYDDSYPSWLKLMGVMAPESFRLAKPQAHLYIFCDIDRFVELRDIIARAGWTPFRTPLVWHNPTSQRAPWPQSGPHRRYQLCLYAKKGDRPVLKLSPDVVTYASDQNLGWAAQKPVGLLQDLLLRSCRAGDTVFDPFAGSGSIFPAAHGLKIKAVGVETDPTAYGIAVKRIAELK
jgi:DNA modification methylase/ParB-like chromosome segregation protein Spo0J